MWHCVLVFLTFYLYLNFVFVNFSYFPDRKPESSHQNNQQSETVQNFEIVGDENFLIAKSVNTRVHMKHRDVP